MAKMYVVGRISYGVLNMSLVSYSFPTGHHLVIDH